ncbi:MAG: hypothetical protein ABI772_11155, partial [Bacteroidota bacterium]
MRRLILAIVLTFTVFSGYSSHMMGGEITWRCSGNNYVFYLKIYRDCRGSSFTTATQQITVSGNPSISSINCAFVSLTDLSAPGCGYSCADINPPQGATEEYVFKSAPINLGAGTPPAAGWVFSWNLCCRNNSIQNIANPGLIGMTLRSKMFSYNGQPATPCFDNSPAFAERPSSFICTGYSYTYNHTAIDIEFDSLRYTWDRPADNIPPVLLSYLGPYTTNNQLPGNPTLDQNTGEVNIFPAAGVQGDFVTCVRVDAFKCNVKVAEIYREIQVGLSNLCGVVSTGLLNQPPSFLDPTTNLGYQSIVDTIIAGDSAHFDIKVQDTDFNLPLSLQVVTVEIIGQAMDSAYFAAPNTGCGRPPCATLNKVTPYSFSPADRIIMNWKTSCNHLPRKQGCVSLSNAYTFVLKARDNFCPAPGRKNVTVTIIVVEPPKLLPPKLRCLDVDTAGHVTLSWTPPTPVDTFNTFYNYQILRSINKNGPYVTIDSVLVYGSGSYTDTTVNAQQQKYYYSMLTRCGCDSLGLSKNGSDTLQTIKVTASFATAGSSVATVKWNPLKLPLPLTNFNGYYHIYRTNHALNTTVFVDSTNFVDTTNNYVYLDTLAGCIDSITWKVGIMDSSQCWSWSSLGGTTFVNDTVVEPPTVNCVSVLPNGNVTLDWSEPLPADTGRIFGGYIIYRSSPSSAGPYSQIGAVTSYGTKTYTDATANVYTGGPYFYYITTLDSCGMIESDSAGRVRPIILNADTTGGNGNVLLNWNNFHFPSQPAAYEIRKKVSTAAVWDSITTVNNIFTYRDTIDLCRDSVVYQVRVLHGAPDACTSLSSIDGDSVKSATPVISPVSPRCTAVQTNGDVIVSWKIPSNIAGFF